MKRHLTNHQFRNLHPTVSQLLPPSECAVYHQHACETIQDYPILNLAECKSTKHIISPSLGESSGELRKQEKFGAFVTLTRSGVASPVLYIRAVLIGKLVSHEGALRITDSRTASHIVIAPPPNVSMRDKFVYANNWRYIPGRNRRNGYFEVLACDLILLTRAPHHNAYVPSPPNAESNDACLSGMISAKSCKIATRKRGSCFLVELKGSTHATVVVFTDNAVNWWPFLRVGACVTLRRLKVSSLRSYNRRTVFAASSAALVVESTHVKSPSADPAQAQFSHQAIPSSNSVGRNRARFVYRKITVDYEGYITQILPDGRFQLDNRISFHPGPVHSFAPDMVVSSAFRVGTKLKLLNTLLVQRDEQVRLFPTAKTSVEILYFGELKIMCRRENSGSWHPSGWDRLWKRLDCDDVVWAEETYDFLVAKFWHWLRGSSEDADEATDSDRIACLLGDKGEIGLVQYTMHLLSGREELLKPEGYTHRDICKEFLELPRKHRSISHAFLPFVITLERLKELVFDSEMKHETIHTEPSFHRLDISPMHQDVVLLHQSHILRGVEGSKTAAKDKTLSYAPPVLAGLLHKFESEHNGLALSDATTTLPVRIVGLLEPALIGAIIVVTSYYLVIDFRHAAGESVTAVFAADSVKTVVDGPFTEMGNRSASGPLVCETQTCNRNYKPVENSALSHVALSRRKWHQSADGEDAGDFSTRIADVPLICAFIENLVLASDRVELCGKLLAVSKRHVDDVWKAVLRDKQNRSFWDCRIVLSGDAAVDLAPVFRENRLWGVSCIELECEDDPCGYIQRKGREDENSTVVLSSNFDGFVPWVEDLGKGEYMRYGAEGSDHWSGGSNLSVMSREGAVYNTVRDAVESFYQLSVMRVTTRLWELHDGGNESDMVHIRGTITRNPAWNQDSKHQKRVSEWILTIRDDELAYLTVTIDFCERVDCMTGLAAGIRVVLYNIHRSRPTTWGRYRFKAGENTIVRCIGVPEEFECSCPTLCEKIDQNVVQILPQIDLVDIEVHDGSKWVGILRFDILNLHEVRLCTRQTHCPHHGSKKLLEISVTLSIEDGTTHGRLHATGAAAEALMDLSKAARDRLEALAGQGVVHLDEVGARQHGLMQLWNACGFGWRRVTGVVVGTERVVGDEAVVKCFRLGFGQCIWTASRRECAVVECVAVIREGPALVRELLYALEG